MISDIITSAKEMAMLVYEQLPIFQELQHLISTIIDIVEIPVIGIPVAIVAIPEIYIFFKKLKRRKP